MSQQKTQTGPQQRGQQDWKQRRNMAFTSFLVQSCYGVLDSGKLHLPSLLQVCGNHCADHREEMQHPTPRSCSNSTSSNDGEGLVGGRRDDRMNPHLPEDATDAASVAQPGVRTNRRNQT